MAPELSPAVRVIVDRLVEYEADDSWDVICAELLFERTGAKASGRRSDELQLTLLLARALHKAGREEEALMECLYAESVDRSSIFPKLAIAFQLKNMGRESEAVKVWRTVLGDPAVEPPERHAILAALGEYSLNSDPGQSRRLLLEAASVAIASSLHPWMWNHALAAKLAARGDEAAKAYLASLRDLAIAANDEQLVEELSRIINDSMN